MNMTVKVYSNCDETYIVWKYPEKIENCRGFGLIRKRNGKEEVVETWVGFQGEEAAPGTCKPSSEWPIQKFMWSDYLVKPGDKVRYRVVPMIGGKDQLKADQQNASSWTEEVIVANPGNAISAYFNRGIVASQWLNRRLEDGTPSDKQEKLGKLIDNVNNKTRQFLAGELRIELLKLRN